MAGKEFLMSEYRRFFVPAWIHFLTLLAYQRRPSFARPRDVQRLRATVVLPD